MMVSLSNLIRRGFEDACEQPCVSEAFQEAQCLEPVLRGLCLADLPPLMHRRSIPSRRQDELLEGVIRAYRRGPRVVWGPILLAMLGPAVVRAAARLTAQPPAIEESDIDQQVVFETLRAAARMPLPEDCRFVQRRLMWWAIKPVVRWLERESRRPLPNEAVKGAKEGGR
ncbi:MAG: hypothetical protein ACHQ0J_15400 [Candidatus Dormibacterales bacterium]